MSFHIVRWNAGNLLRLGLDRSCFRVHMNRFCGRTCKPWELLRESCSWSSCSRDGRLKSRSHSCWCYWYCMRHGKELVWLCPMRLYERSWRNQILYHPLTRLDQSQLPFRDQGWWNFSSSCRRDDARCCAIPGRRWSWALKYLSWAPTCLWWP